MADALVLVALGTLTALACGLGAIPVFALGERITGAPAPRCQDGSRGVSSRVPDPPFANWHTRKGRP